MWWKYLDGGVEFFDAEVDTQLPKTPTPHHFRSTTMADIDAYLMSKWEQCIDMKITLPAFFIRTFTTNGESHSIIEYPPPVSLTPCPSSSSTWPLLSLTLCPSSDSTQTTQSPLLLTPCPSSGSTQSPLSLTPCPSSGLRQTTQQRSLLLTSCTSRGATSILPPKKLQLSSNAHPESTIAKSMLLVLPKNKHDKVLEFDAMRKVIKRGIKEVGITTHIINQKYQAASTALQEYLIDEFKQNSRQINMYCTGNSVNTKTLIHKNNVIKKLLNHEWNIHPL